MSVMFFDAESLANLAKSLCIVSHHASPFEIDNAIYGFATDLSKISELNAKAFNEKYLDIGESVVPVTREEIIELSKNIKISNVDIKMAKTVVSLLRYNTIGKTDHIEKEPLDKMLSFVTYFLTY